MKFSLVKIEIVVEEGPRKKTETKNHFVGSISHLNPILGNLIQRITGKIVQNQKEEGLTMEPANSEILKIIAWSSRYV